MNLNHSLPSILTVISLVALAGQSRGTGAQEVLISSQERHSNRTIGPAGSGGTAIFLHFDEFSDGTRLTDQYAQHGVHFQNDYQPGRPFRATPTIRPYAQARTSPNVLVNEAFDEEIFSSHDMPLVIWFDQPMAGVGMWLGTVGSQDHPCNGTFSGQVTVYDCQGNQVGNASISASTAFNTPLEIDDPQGRIQRVVIDYGSTSCPEAIDELAFMTGAGSCTDSSPPLVTITSHGSFTLVNTPVQLLEGTVQESGVLKSLKLDGQTLPHNFQNGLYHFSAQVTVPSGGKTYTVMGENVSGLKGSAQTTIVLGEPTSIALDQFHLTQRGVMLNKACDIDSPLVAGKSAVVRIQLKVLAGTAPSYVSAVELRLKRKTAVGDELVNTYQGTTYSPYVSTFKSPSHMAAIHFWIDGVDLDPAGEYRFEFQPYIGLNGIGQPILANCGGTYLKFEDTKSIKYLILPVEAGILSPLHVGTDYGKNYTILLHSIQRAFPVRDDFSPMWWAKNTGLRYVEAAPLRLCDGTEATKQSFTYCQGTGFRWTFVDKSGTLRRADAVTHTVSATYENICGAKKDRKLGGRIINSNIINYNFNAGLGVFRPGAHPGWFGAKHAIPLDTDHDGDIDSVDLGRFIKEFWDANATPEPKWETNLALYDSGEIFRFFQDLDGDNCNDAKVTKWSNNGIPTFTEPQAEVRYLFEIWKRALMYDPVNQVLQAHNQLAPLQFYDANQASLWLPQTMIAPTPFMDVGGGQGGGSKFSWIKVESSAVSAHELGHNFGLTDLYLQSLDPDPDDLVSKENAWAVYVNRQSINPVNSFGIMAVGNADTDVFVRTNYQALFNKLKASSGTASLPQAASASERQVLVSGQLFGESEIFDLRTDFGRDLPETPMAPESPYHLILGVEESILLDYPFEIPAEMAPPEGYDTWPQSLRYFTVVAPAPEEPGWIEIWHQDRFLIRAERSAAAPTVHLLTPNGGESFGPDDAVVVQWEAEDQDGDALTFRLGYSPDGGENWIVVASALQGNEFLWTLGDMPGTPFGEGRLRIRAGDGFNFAADMSDESFVVEGKPPVVAILSPSPEQRFLEGEQIWLHGSAFDPEGRLANTAWIVDDEEIEGGISSWIDNLNPGSHVVALRAFDEQELSNLDEVVIHILGDADRDGMSDEFEEEYGLSPGLVDDAAWDSDEDLLSNFDESWRGLNPRNPDSDGDGFIDGEEVLAGSDPANRNSTPSPVIAEPVYVNCGAEAEFGDDAGRVWVPDSVHLAEGHPAVSSYATGEPIGRSLLSDSTVPQDVLSSETWRDGDIHYAIPMPNGEYLVTLYFAEIYPSAVSPALGGTGCEECRRTFEVETEGAVVPEFTPADAALGDRMDGEGLTFEASELNFEVGLEDGVLDILLYDYGAGNPPENVAIKGIAVLPLGEPPPLEPLRITHFELLPEAMLEIFWTGGRPPFLVQMNSRLGSGAWETIAESEGNAAQIPISGTAGFLRVALAEEGLPGISDIKGPEWQSFVGQRLLVEGFFIADPVPMLVTDLNLARVNMPMLEHEYVVLIGAQAEELDPEILGGARLWVEGDVVMLDDAAGQGPERVALAEIEYEMIDRLAPYAPSIAPVRVGTPPAVPREDRFAILFSGGIKQSKNYVRYWNDLKFMYRTLIDSCGFNANNIAVLYANGQARDQQMPVHYSATGANMATVMTQLRRASSGEDLIFIFTTNHGGGFYKEKLYTADLYGGQLDTGHDEVNDLLSEATYNVDFTGNGSTNDQFSWDEELFTWGGGIIDDTFHTILADLNYDTMIILMEQCFSGGMIPDMAQGGGNRIIMAATGQYKPSYSNNSYTFDEFSYHFTAAINGANHNGTAVNADTNSDGEVSIVEAFNYAVNHDVQDETPLYEDSGDGIPHSGTMPGQGEGSLGGNTTLEP